jgi:hypothetical protein
MYLPFESAAPPTSGWLGRVSYTAIIYPVHITNFTKGMLIDENASDAVEDQDIAGGQLHRMNQRSARGGRGSGLGRGGSVVGLRARQDNIYSHQSSRPVNITSHQTSRPENISGHQSSRVGNISGDARQASPNPPPVRTFMPNMAIPTPVDEPRSRAQSRPTLDRPMVHRQVPEPSVSPVQRRQQVPPVVERPVSRNVQRRHASQTRDRLMRLRVNVK